MKIGILCLGLAALVFVGSCKKDKDNTVNAPQPQVYLDLSDTAGKYFKGNYAEVTDMKAVLGRVLFYDKQLSINNAIACASCHKQEFAFADNVAASRGFEGRLTGRNSMALQNFTSGNPTNIFSPFTTGFLFWDGREFSLINLVSRPILNHVEMGMDDINKLPAKLAALGYYQNLFRDAYGSDSITMERISDAMAFFMSSIVSGESRYDMYLQQKGELTAQELHGLQLFNQKYNCASCHRVVTGAYPASHIANIGLDATTTDRGAGAIDGIGFPDGSFKVPNLRNVARTAPYMHDGRFNTLEEVIEHYSSGIQNHPGLDDRLKDEYGKPMRMNISKAETQSIIAFLNSLTDYAMLAEPKYSNPFKTK
ncbi:MAG: c-type cytochrome [Taibaiella sp.]|nr:c-type cytochrome [Taibaiella sp.]